VPGFAPPTQGNDLLTSWGRVLQDTFGLLFRHDDLLNSYTELPSSEPSGNHLLGKIQQDIFENAVGTDRAALSPEDLRDGSLSFHACYTPAREVEALYNYLVRLADRSSGAYSPRDIVVMVSDIDAYAPYIKAVFGSAPYTFPFTIADESYQAVDGFFSTLQTLMELREESFRAEDVLQLLELRYVRERFRITDTGLIRKVVAEANIRFGVRGDHSDDSDTVSWVHGLDRLIYGICLHGDEPYLHDGELLYPLDRAEGGQAFELIRFSHFVQVLISVVGAQNRPRTMTDWISYLAESVGRLIYEPAGDEDEDYILFVQQLERLGLAAEEITEAISFAAFRQHFISQLSGATKAGNFMTGGITFCSLIPMRSIPFRTVCLLGLNFDQFPRRETTLSFNILQQHPQKGDRNVKENDKHLFLETLLSARETLYISYIGRNSKDNSSLPPSAMVDELLDYIAAGTGSDAQLVRQQLLQLHPLHSFSQRYADTANGLYTYLGDGSSGTTAVVAATGAKPFLPAADLTEISLGALIAFYKNPFKYFYNKVLSVYEDNEEVLLADTEVFELNRLQHWQLKHDLLLLPDGELPAYLDRGVHTGQLPLSRMGELTLSETAAAVQPARDLIAPYTARTEPVSCSFALQAGDHTLTGTLTNIYGHRLLVPAFSKSDRKYHLECWLKHLAATASGLGLQTHYIAGNEATEVVLPPGLLTAEQATAYLQELIALFARGHERPLLFLPGKDIAHEKLEENDDDAFFRLFTDQLISGFKVTPDPYVLSEYQQGLLKRPGMLAEWRANIQTILTPFAAYFD
jgi:exodeoxyribonuclease V gamma subunit